MFAGLKILIFSMLLRGTLTSPDPAMSSEVDFLGFFDENKYCYLRNSCLRSYNVGYITTLEFVVKDFEGKTLKREILLRHVNDKTEYLGKTNILRFLRKNNVQTEKRVRGGYDTGFNIFIKNNLIYSRISSEADTTIIADSNAVRKLILKHNKEPILIDYVKYINEIKDAKIGDFEKNVVCSRVKEVYEKNDYYLVIIYNDDEGDDPGKQDMIIVIDKKN